MAITIDFLTKVIDVPKLDMTFIGIDPISGRDIYDLNINTFRLAVSAIMGTEAGAPHPDPYRHDTESDLSGTVYARKILMINGYTVEFEDGQYAVNLIAANSNIQDVTVVNQVSIRPQNSAGLVNALASINIASLELSFQNWNEQYSAALASMSDNPPLQKYLLDLQNTMNDTIRELSRIATLLG